jgi:chromosome segregation ATPase
MDSLNSSFSSDSSSECSAYDSYVVRETEPLITDQSLLARKRQVNFDMIDRTVDSIRYIVTQDIDEISTTEYKLNNEESLSNTTLKEKLDELKIRKSHTQFIRNELSGLNSSIQQTRGNVSYFIGEYDKLYYEYTKSSTQVEAKEKELNTISRRFIALRRKIKSTHKELKQQINKLQDSNKDKDLHLVEANLKIADLEKQLAKSKMQKFITNESIFSSFNNPNLCKETITHLAATLLTESSDEQIRMKRMEYLG